MSKPRKRYQQPESSLMQRTRQLLAESPLDRLTIYNDTRITPHWLYLFQTGRIADPSVNRVEVLFLYLGGTWKDLVHD